MTLRFVGGDDGHVLVMGPRGTVDIGVYEWGDQTPKCADLARIMVSATLDNDVKGVLLYRRFMHRAITSLTKGAAWTMTDDEIKAIIVDIQQVEKDAAPMRAIARFEIPKDSHGQPMIDRLPPDVFESVGKNPTLVRNDPAKARDR